MSTTNRGGGSLGEHGSYEGFSDEEVANGAVDDWSTTHVDEYDERGENAAQHSTPKHSNAGQKVKQKVTDTIQEGVSRLKNVRQKKKLQAKGGCSG
jgi:hypothetical protein